MTNTTGNARIARALKTLSDSGVVPEVAGILRANSQAFANKVLGLVEAEVSAYSDSANPDIRPELEAHLAEHVEEICRLLAGTRPGDLAFVRRHAERRAEQKFPLDAILQAYGCLHKALSHWIRDAALKAADDTAHVRRVVAAVTDFTIEYSGAIVTLITSDYVDHTRLLAESESDRRTALLNLLLSGYDESDRHAANVLRRAGYLEQRQSYCVAVARSVDPREMEHAARAQRMADALSVALRDLPIRTLVGVRENLVMVVLSGARRLSGWTAPQSLLADRVYPALRKVGPAALIGLSADAPSTAHIPQALGEARLALDYASVAERVVPYAAIPFQQMLVRLARQNLPPTRPAWLMALEKADARAKGVLSSTLSGYANNNMNVLKTAKALAIHPNTIYARFLKIQELTGRNPLAYHALTELLLASQCHGQG